MGTYKFLFIFQVKIERIHIDGLGRTKDEIAIEQVKDVFQASTFKELIERSGEAKLKLERLGIFTGVGVLIDTSKGMGSASVVHTVVVYDLKSYIDTLPMEARYYSPRPVHPKEFKRGEPSLFFDHHFSYCTPRFGTIIWRDLRKLLLPHIYCIIN